MSGLEKTLSKLNATYGQGAVRRMSETVDDIEVTSTGSLSLDIILGCQGFPKGRIVEIYGPESSGKTTLAIHAMAEVQKSGGTVAIIDAEHAFDKKYAENLGIVMDDIIICQPDYGEMGLEVVDQLASSGEVDMIVIDSVAALTPKAELDGEMGDSKMGLQARLMSQAMRKITGNAKKNNCCVVFINQLREKIGVMFGNPETTTGGNALKYYASIRIDIRRSAAIKETDGTLIGVNAKVKVAKNKVGPPFGTCVLEIGFGIGIKREAEILAMALELDFIKKAGSWYSFQGDKIGQGKIRAVEFLQEHDHLAEALEKEIKEFYLEE